MTFYHHPVMVKEVLNGLLPVKGGIYVDGTIGGGGHTEEILKFASYQLIIIGLDKDRDAIDYCREKFRNTNVVLFNADFAQIDEVLRELKVEYINGLLLDLGVSSFQLNEANKGFSFLKEGTLDMRMNMQSGKKAYDVVNSYSEDELLRIFFRYGEESKSKIIAKAVTEQRKKFPIKTTRELAEIIEKLIPRWQKNRIHPATRIFQAIRIEVNDELKSLKEGLAKGVRALKQGGRVAVISYHSLEDRIVKDTFNYFASSCICPKDLPVCKCSKTKEVEIITRKPVVPSADEIGENPRSRSAKLRIAQRC